MCFSDKATFHLGDIMNRHNCIIWGSQQPQEIVKYQRDTPKINVWCGMWKDGIIGPFFFQEATMTSCSYMDILEYYAVQQFPCDAWFQQDGAPPHFLNILCQFLNECLPDKCIGRGGFLAWPPRSPDLTPLYFVLWGYVKNIIYHEKIACLQTLQHCITVAIATVTIVMFVNMWHEIEYHFDVCQATNGAHAETYYMTKETEFCATELRDGFLCIINIFPYMNIYFFSRCSQTPGIPLYSCIPL
jgi:hypothetical protein